LLSALLVVAVAVVGAAGASGRVSGSSCVLRWTKEAAFPGKLTAFRALPNGEKWATGWIGKDKPTAAFIEHEQNGVWIRMLAGPGSGDAVVAGSMTDVLVVGHHLRGSSWALAFDGRRWRAITPVPPHLDAKAARLAPWFWFDTLHKGSIYFWDGRQLHARPAPSGDPGFVRDIAATNAHPVWLARDCGITIWDGSSWRTVLPTSCSSHEGYSWSTIDAASPTDVWAIAESELPTKFGKAAHWDGHRWRIFLYPEQVRGVLSDPQDLVVVSTREAWMLSDAGAILHWDGSTWAPARAPAPLNPYLDSPRLRFMFIDADRPNSIWLAGWRSFPYATGTSAVYHGICQ